MGDGLGEVAKSLGVLGAVAMVLIAAGTAAVRTIRQDRHIDDLVGTMQTTLDEVRQDRDYWKGRAEEDQTALERRFEQRLADVKEEAERRLADVKEEAAEARGVLYTIIEDLRQQLQRHMNVHRTPGD